MRLSTSFWQTYKEIPNDAEIPSHQLLVRAGLVSKSANGIYNYLPMMVRSLRKIERIIREELDSIGAQEVIMSVVTPGDLWKETGRWDKMGPQMLKFKDRAERDLCMSPTNEEAVVDIFRKAIQSYKQLPVNLYQINTKFRDEIRPRFGLMRGREFLMKDAYSFHLTKESLDKTYEDYYKAYSNIFTRLGLEFIVVEADGGAIAGGNAKTHEFQVVADAGEDQVITAPEIKYAANIEKAETKRAGLNFKSAIPLNPVSTPAMKTIAEVSGFLKIPENQTLKSVVLQGVVGNKDVVAVFLLLGDDELNEVKASSIWKVEHMRPASPEQITEMGAYPGFIGPIGLKNEVQVFIDAAVNLDAAYIVGANKVDTHYEGFVPKRDLKQINHVDLRLSKIGDVAKDGKSKIEIKRGIEVGHIFQLGDLYSKGMKAEVVSQDGRPFAPLMGCYGIGVTRCLQSAIEQNHDSNGISWPAAIAPFQLYFAVIAKSAETQNMALEVYNDLLKAGIEVLFDDRGFGPGQMFKDADLLGLPLRLVLGERDFAATGEFELKFRRSGEVLKVKRDNLVNTIKDCLKKCP